MTSRNNNEWIPISVMEIEQPIGSFFMGKAPANQVIEICSADKRRKTVDDELDRYVGMQRELNERRKKEIGEFVITMDASFPNSIILAVRDDAYSYDEKEKILWIKKDKSSCNILDGQHRLSGFPAETENNFELILTIFPQIDMEYQAYLFSVINTKSTRINPSLAQDLHEFSKVTTPEKLAHRIARVFNTTENNPWYRRIKILGRKEDNEYAILSQSTFTKYIVELISKKEETYNIRDILKRTNDDRKALKDMNIKRPLWEKYVNEEDKYIYDLLKYYFKAAQEKFKDDWGSHDSIITKTAGYTALMNVLKFILKKEGLPEKPSVEYFKNYFDKVSLENIKPLDSDHYKPGQGGERDLQNNILKEMGLK